MNIRVGLPPPQVLNLTFFKGTFAPPPPPGRPSSKKTPLIKYSPNPPGKYCSPLRSGFPLCLRNWTLHMALTQSWTPFPPGTCGFPSPPHRPFDPPSQRGIAPFFLCFPPPLSVKVPTPPVKTKPPTSFFHYPVAPAFFLFFRKPLTFSSEFCTSFFSPCTYPYFKGSLLQAPLSKSYQSFPFQRFLSLSPFFPTFRTFPRPSSII